METTKIKSVFHNFGEVSYTEKNFIGLFISEDLENNKIEYFDGNENHETKINDYRLYSNDDFRLDNYRVSEIKEVEILFFDNDKNMSIRIHKNYNFFIIRNFKNLSKIENEKIASVLIYQSKNWEFDYTKNILDLLVYSGKSSFKNSLKNQVMQWMENFINDKLNKYNRPLSDKQYNGLTKYNPENLRYLNQY